MVAAPTKFEAVAPTQSIIINGYSTFFHQCLTISYPNGRVKTLKIPFTSLLLNQFWILIDAFIHPQLLRIVSQCQNKGYELFEISSLNTDNFDKSLQTKILLGPNTTYAPTISTQGH